MQIANSAEAPLFQTTEWQSGAQLRELLGCDVDPVAMIKKIVIPEVEARGKALTTGEYDLEDLPELGGWLEAVMEELGDSLAETRTGLQFRIGRARNDAFDLWGGVVAGAIEAAGFKTIRTNEMDRCEVTLGI